MIFGINKSVSATNAYYFQNKKQYNNIAFGRLEADDSFEREEKNKKNGFFGKIKEKVCSFLGKIGLFYLSLSQKEYNNNDALEYTDNLGKEFRKTSEGIRRSSMSDEEIEKEIKTVYNESFDELDIPKELRPKLLIHKKYIKDGEYQTQNHSINLSINAYRSFPCLESLIMHEATHCKEALMRAGIPQSRVEELIKNELITNDKTILMTNFNNGSAIIPPKIPDSMKEDFVKFADENLFDKDPNVNYVLSLYDLMMNNSDHSYDKILVPLLKNIFKFRNKGLIENIEKLLQNHPEYSQLCGSKEIAFNSIMMYSLALNTEYNFFTNTQLYGENDGVKPIKVKELKGEELKQAEKSLINWMSTIRGNELYYKTQAGFGYFMYAFSPEEVLAETNGRKFQIKKCEEELEKGKKEKNLTKEKETLLKLQIEYAKATIEYREFGSSYYDKFNELVVNPTNEELKNYLIEKEKELVKLEQKVKELEQKIISYDKQN